MGQKREDDGGCSGGEGLTALIVCEAVRKCLDMEDGGGMLHIETLAKEIRGSVNNIRP